MKVQAVSEPIFSHFAEKQGKWIPIAPDYAIIPDEAYRNPSFKRLVDDNIVTVLAFDSDPTSVVNQAEFSLIAGGIFKSSHTASGTAASGDNEHAKSLSTDTSGSFEFLEDRMLVLLVDGLYTEEFRIPKGKYSFSAMAMFLNNLTEHLTFAQDGTPNFWAETKSYGSNASVAVQSGHGYDANSVLNLPTNSTNAASPATPEVVDINIKGPTGQACTEGKMKLSVWDAATGGSLVTDAYFQRVQKGSYDSMYSNEIEMTPDDDGDMKLEMVKIAAATVYLAIEAPTGYFLADVPTSREAIAVS